MHRTHIRSYRVREHGDVEVVDIRAVETIDLSSHYADVARDRGSLRVDTCLDVFRTADGHLVWAVCTNGHDNAAAASLALLLHLFLEDSSGGAAPRTL